MTPHRVFDRQGDRGDEGRTAPVQGGLEAWGRAWDEALRHRLRP